MKYFLGTVGGALTGLFLLSLVGAVFGAVDPPCIACGKTVGPFFGAIIGVIGFGLKFGLPVAATGSVFGAVGSCFWREQGGVSQGPVVRPLPGNQAYWANPESERIRRLEEKGIQPE